jgi:serine/threonine protein kinase/tetratricopeptide (TPR) repeat protein
MDCERWAHVKDIVNRCLDGDSAEPSAQISAECAGDPTLIADVASLLASYRTLGDFLEPALPDEEQEDIPSGTQLGQYRICQRIAEGGMGAVYRAVRCNDFQKQVAVKVVKRGMDTNFVLRRFRQERQILAALDHPNIARLLDGGAADDNRPYLVMEYVEGTPITEYSEKHALTTRQRLELFRTVCSAVQYAHQNLVVHRDLKPGNILVTSESVPKLLDFGIAKMLLPESDVTVTSLRLMTPDCASPEQVRGEPVTTATDVYALGVLLYHLLTGRAPLDFTTSSPEEVRRVICEIEPEKPSSIRPLPADLDNIVLKAMHKDPAHRYSSVERLSEDIRRYLTGRPVAAHRDSFRYRAFKFVRRHRAATALVALIVLSITGGVGATLWEAHIAQMERARAERRFSDVRQLSNSLIFELHDAIQELPGATPVRKLFIDKGLHYLDGLAKDSSDDPSLQRDIAAGYERVGLLQGQYGNANLGDAAGALQSLRKALALRKEIAAHNPTKSSDNLALAGSYRRLAVQLLANGSPTVALVNIQKATQVSEDMLKRTPGNREALRELGFDYEAYGMIQGGSPASLGDLDGALRSFQKALATDEARLKIDPHSEDIKRAIEIDYVHLGGRQAGKGEFKEALISEQKSLEMARELASGSSSVRLRRDVAVACNQVAARYEDMGQFKQALNSYVEGRNIYLELAAVDPRNATVQNGLAVADLNVGNMLAKTGHPTEGLALMDQGVQADEKLIAADPANSVERGRLGDFYITRAEAREQAGMLSGALADFKKALAISQRRAAEDPNNRSAQLQVMQRRVSIERVSAEMTQRR